MLIFDLADLYIESLNHSVKFNEGFVGSMEVVMDRRIKDHIHAFDKVTGRKRLFPFAADEVNKLHMTCDVVGMLIMTEERVIKPIFVD